MKKYFLVLGLITVLCVTLFGCGDSNTDLLITDAVSVTESTTEDPLTLNPSLMGIATKYGDLRYPKRWSEQLRTEVVEKGGNAAVEMYGTIGEHEELHLYDVVFGGDEGVPIGTVEADGEKVYVKLISYDLDFDDSWSEDEILTVKAMKEDINYLIDELSAN